MSLVVRAERSAFRFTCACERSAFRNIWGYLSHWTTFLEQTGKARSTLFGLPEPTVSRRGDCHTGTGSPQQRYVALSEAHEALRGEDHLTQESPSGFRLVTRSATERKRARVRLKPCCLQLSRWVRSADSAAGRGTRVSGTVP